jgi:hypothetical protein
VPELELGPEQGPAPEVTEDEVMGDEGRRGRKTAMRTTRMTLERSGAGGGSGGRESHPTSWRAAVATRVREVV